MLDEEAAKRIQESIQFIDCEECGKPVFLQSTPQDTDLQTRYYYMCLFCGFSDADVPVAPGGES